MPFALVANQKFRVSFVHSGHNLKENRGMQNPGGYRHFVDDIAKSLNRRTTIVEISLETLIPGPLPHADPVIVNVPLGYGIALCYHTDRFVKEEGRGLALLRALRNAKRALTVDMRDAIAASAGFVSFAALKQRFASPTRCTCKQGRIDPKCPAATGDVTLTDANASGKSSLAGLLYPTQTSTFMPGDHISR